ncbi:hypothetical protein MLD38_007258 [Melastoma candidum]|uniref:Uncharacterized protein n=1 Tax=Melastoma candidum TaxID=119954 RepID=A0ACB9RPT6_9MYRT|nr:hypothetical protein MLD38_007258 [Melastoma candidum]
MADPSGKKPSSPHRGSGSGSGNGNDNGSEEKRSEPTMIPCSDNNGDGSSTPPVAPPLAQTPVTQPPVAQAGQSSGRLTKKKGKMGMKAGKGIAVGVAEEPGKKKFASLENLPGRARTCSICMREFPTARALFGHMRSHPERMWRGAHPPPVSPRWEEAAKHEEEQHDVEQTQPALELTGNLLKIGERILRTVKFKGKEGEIQAGGMNVGSSSGFMPTTHGSKFEKAGEATGRQGGSSSGDSGKKKKKRNTKKKPTKALDYTDEEQRKRIHSQIDLNKEASAEDDAGEEETPSTSD